MARHPLDFDLAPRTPTSIEAYVACRSVGMPIPRVEVKRLRYDGLIDRSGRLTPLGQRAHGRVVAFRKIGRVEPEPEPPEPTSIFRVAQEPGEPPRAPTPPPKPLGRYQGPGNRRQRRANRIRPMREPEVVA